MRPGWRRQLGGALSLALLCACTSRQVVRIVDGAPVAHRPISIRAYSAYARGAVAEATGALNVALSEYRIATDADSGGVEPWVREGAVSCALGSYDAATRAFTTAEERDPAYEPLWTERARCQLTHGDPRLAVTLAQRAIDLDPTSDDAVRTHAEALDRQGDPRAALRELSALAVQRPSPATFRAELEIAKRTGDAASAHAAERGLGARGTDSTQPRTDQAAVDRAIVAGDAEDAIRVGRRAGESPSEVAVRAAALGRYALAHELAEPIVKADPSDTEALIAALASSSPTDVRAADALLSLARPRSRPAVSDLARLVYWEALARLVGRDALDGTSFARDIEQGDDLRRAVALRLRDGASARPDSK